MTPGANDCGASEVIGEMLMIGLAILLISAFASVLGNFSPAARDPGITVMMTYDAGNVTLWHKGGDWIKAEDLAVIIGNDSSRMTYSATDAELVLVPAKQTFDLGSNITIRTGTTFAGDETISLVTARTKIFSGVVHL